MFRVRGRGRVLLSPIRFPPAIPDAFGYLGMFVVQGRTPRVRDDVVAVA